MITVDMAKLSIRMTNLARMNANLEIMRWLNAIKVVKQAEEQAQIPIDLPVSLTAKAMRAADTIKNADYVTAVGLSDIASSAYPEVFDAAIRILENELGTRSSLLGQARYNLAIVETTYQKQMQDSTIGTTQANWSRDFDLRMIRDDLPEFSFGFLDVGFFIIIALPYCVVSYLIRLLIPALRYIIVEIKYAIAAGNAGQKSAAAMESAKSEYSIQMISLNMPVEIALGNQQVIYNALRFLQGQKQNETPMTASK